MVRALLLLLLLATPAKADFVLGNLRFTLLHELGHAVVDQWELPLYGPEETAVDGFALVLADRLLDEAGMAKMIRAMTALSREEAQSELFDPWDEYMPAAQRLSHAICLYHGLRPESRAPLARALGMPKDRAEPCAEIARSVRRAWAPVVSELTSGALPGRLRPGRGKALRLMEKDIRWINRNVALKRDVPVLQEDCHEDNAFYYRYDERIVICSEMVEALRAASGR